MTSRNDMDKPAMLVTAILAVVLIAVSVPFTIKWWGEGTTTYEIEWDQADTGMADAPLTGPGDKTAEVLVDDKHTSNVTVTVETCNDGRGTGNLNPEAQMSYRLFVRHANGTVEQIPGASGAFTCLNSGSAGGTFARLDKPNLGAREVEDANEDDERNEREATRAAVWDDDLLGGLNETATYVLELSATRGPATLPVGAPAPTLAVTMRVTVQHWEALLHETGDDEVVR